MKFRRRKDSRTKRGHRQKYTKIKIKGIISWYTKTGLFLAFQKPKLGYSYPRTKGAEDFTRTIFSRNFSEPWKFLRKLFKMSTLKIIISFFKIIIFLFVSFFIIANMIYNLLPKKRARIGSANYAIAKSYWPEPSIRFRDAKKNFRKLSKILKMKWVYSG